MSDIKQDLWRIQEDFAQHMQLLDILRSEGDDTAPLEGIIKGFFSTDVTREKIDSVIGYIRYCGEMAEAAAAEVKRLSALGHSWKTQAEWLKDTAKGVLEMSGQKRLEGLTAGSLTLRANGGRPAVTVMDASLIPEELVTYQGTISGEAWESLGNIIHPELMKGSRTAREWWFGREDVNMERIPHKGRIGEALAGKCSRCDGAGAANTQSICPACDGDGLARVAGCRLEPRGNSIRVL